MEKERVPSHGLARWVWAVVLSWLLVLPGAYGARLVEETAPQEAPASPQAPPAASSPPAPAAPGKRSPAAPPGGASRRGAPAPAAPPAAPAPQPAAQQEAPAKAIQRPAPSDRITINFDNADIRTVIKFISELTGKNFVVDDKVKGNVTIISPTDITVDEAYRVFLSILEMKGFTLADTGSILKIFPSAEARYRDIETVAPQRITAVGREDRMITQLIPLSFASANDLKGMLTPLVSKESQVVAYVPTNHLIITDYASNIRRLLSIIQVLDVEGADEKISVVPIKYASAQVLANEILALTDKGAQRGTRRIGAPVAATPPGPAQARAPAAAPAAAPGQESEVISVSKLIADDRTNSLIIVASDAETRKIMELIQKLDTPLPPGRNKIHVYPLENAKAEEVLQVLSQLSGRGGVGGGFGTGLGGGLGGGFGAARTGLGGGTGTFGASGLGGASPGVSSGFGSAGLGTGALGSGALGTGGVRSTLGGGGGLFGGAGQMGVQSAVLGEGIQVVADKATNSLIIVADPTDYETIKDLIAKLDVPRSQVLVEGLIAEVSLNKTKSIGVQWNAIKPLPLDTTVLGGTGPAGAGTGSGQPNLDFFNTVGQLAMGVFTGPITIAGTQFLNLQAVIQAFQRASDVNILSTPHILTLNNEEAEIIVAQNIPFLKSQTGTAESTVPGSTPGTGTTAVLQTFEFKDVGITLRILPQISRGKFVRLNIFQEVSDVGAVEALSTTPTTFKRQAKTVVVVENGQTVVIGGLIQDSKREAIAGVPCLASVPWAGNLFRTKTTGPQEKRNLLIFITPHIINTPEEMAEITEQKRLQGEQDRRGMDEWRGQDFEETLEMLKK
jgi:general secretion pathway protein D